MKPMTTSKMSALAVLALALAALAACEDMGKLYPDNPQAEARGEMIVHLTSYGTDHGALEVVMAGGQRLSGTYAPSPVGAPFGDIFKAVYGPYSVLPTAADKGTPTIASLTGAGGMTMQCEFYNDDYMNHGFGSCQTSLGAAYRLSY